MPDFTTCGNKRLSPINLPLGTLIIWDRAMAAAADDRIFFYNQLALPDPPHRNDGFPSRMPGSNSSELWIGCNNENRNKWEVLTARDVRFLPVFFVLYLFLLTFSLIGCYWRPLLLCGRLANGWDKAPKCSLRKPRF